MFSQQINGLLQQNSVTAPSFKGTFARDTIAKVSLGEQRLPASFVVNTANQHEMGQHWVLCFVQQQTQDAWEAVYYDPLGDRIIDSVKRWLSRQGCSRLETNRAPQQAPYSMTCGAFVMYMCYYLAKGRRSFDSILSDFTTNLESNERLAVRFLYTQFGFDFHQDTKPLSREEHVIRMPTELGLLLSDQFQYL